MTVKTNFSKEKLSEIISKYDLGGLKENKPFSSGTVQSNIFLKQQKGNLFLDFMKTAQKNQCCLKVI